VEDERCNERRKYQSQRLCTSEIPERVKIFALVADHRNDDLPDLSAINRSYVLLVAELKKLYGRNAKLSDINDNICWLTFGTIDAIDPYLLWEYSDDYRNHGIDHISKVNSLCIVSGQEMPVIPPELKKILAEATENVASFAEDWLIPVYTFDLTDEGVLLVNGIGGVMKVKKVQAGSAIEMILTQAKANPDVIFKPDLKGHSHERGLRTSLADVGFTGAIKALFLPVMDNQRGIRFRPSVKRSTANSEGIDLTELDRKLKNLGAETIFDTYNLSS